eukprot:TRINITY_DN27293_c0_g1_i1.p1 TRINITY_DN27293_c0_g1~~TRINITY_DN27293_c0_g1_i1.p1  ORF type:complete len:439 (-),score=86.91 TRINITY_DN27293_c0_g1_i1:203-1519(-)
MFGGLFKSIAPRKRPQTAGRGVSAKSPVVSKGGQANGKRTLSGSEGVDKGGGDANGGKKKRQRSRKSGGSNSVEDQSEANPGADEEEDGQDENDCEDEGFRGSRRAGRAARRRAERRQLAESGLGRNVSSSIAPARVSLAGKGSDGIGRGAEVEEKEQGESSGKRAGKARKKKRRKDMESGTKETTQAVQHVPSLPPSLLSVAGNSSSSGKAAERLKGSRFRWLNEALYTTTGKESKELFDKDPSLAFAYHEGFRAQRAKWPRNPLNDVIAWLRKKVPKGSTIGDFGCGEALIALELVGHHTVHSFDLIAVNERVTPCNIANVPLADGSLDVAVFCLALMGTDWLSFLAEARRCLKPGGLCHIVEVESRFADMKGVVKNIEAQGFRQVLFNPGNFFVDIRFARTSTADVAVPSGEGRVKKRSMETGGALLRSCTYRRR